ncbi:MAG: HAMP domain-containing sensor histidine kinase [Pseudomonadota bacterium]
MRDRIAGRRFGWLIIAAATSACIALITAALYADIPVLWLVNVTVLIGIVLIELVILQRRLERHTADADAALADSDATKTRFLASLSHEFRTPLNAVIGFTELVQCDTEQRLHPRHADYLDIVAAQGRRLLELVDDALELARTSSGTVPLDLGAVDVRALFAEIDRVLAPSAAEYGARLCIDYPQRPLTVRSHARALTQILLNFTTNAIKYGGVGGRITLTTERQGSNLRIMVSDTGPGLSPEHQQRMFTPFDRIGREGGSIEGTGIGLAVARDLAGRLGETIGVETAPGEGLSIWLDVPLDGKADTVTAVSSENRVQPELLVNS